MWRLLLATLHEHAPERGRAPGHVRELGSTDDVVDLEPVLTVHVLGAVEVRRDGQPLELGGPLQRAVIAHLALEQGRVVSVERLIDRLWGDEPPRAALGTLQSYVSRLRRQLEPARATGAAPEVLVSEAPGYVLAVPAEQIDVHRFRTLTADGRSAAAAGSHTKALAAFDEALALWRGPALGGAGPEDAIRPIVVRLEEERDAAREDRFDTLLALGRHVECVPRLQSAVQDRPLRERLWAQLALALYRSSRQADALRTLGEAREMLLDQLGLDPGPELRELEQRILAQDPGLLAVTAAAPAPVVVSPLSGVAEELVGRVDEWRVLTGALDAAQQGRPQLVLVEGEPGMGKTTVCDALVRHAAEAGWATAVGRCVEPGLAPTLWPMIEAARAIDAIPRDTGAAENATNPWHRLAAGIEEGAAGTSLVEMAEHFVALLDELGLRPLLLLVDDLHWADQATLDVLRLVLERLGTRPVVVVGPHRPPEIVPDSLLGDAIIGLHRAAATTERVRMSPLDAEAVGRLVELTSGVAPPADVAGIVQLRAGGNPLFVTELARLTGSRGLTDERVVPDAIRDVVRDRLTQLPERATAELEVAAVLGERFDLRIAMAASERDPDDCLDALDAAIVTRILVPEGDGFRFSHALVRDAVLAGLAPLRRARLHHRAAEAILAVRGDIADEAEPVAHHRLASASFADPVVVARAAVRASDVARWRNALEAAATFTEAALRVLADAPHTPEVDRAEIDALEALVSAAVRSNDGASLKAAVARVAEHAERTGSHASQAMLMFLTWGAVDETDDLSTLDAANEKVAALAAVTTDKYAIVTTRYMLASMAFLEGRLDDAAEHADIAIVASGATDPDERPEQVPLVLLPVIAGLTAAVRGDREEAITHAHRRTSAWLSQRSEVDATAHVALAFNRALVHAILDEPVQVIEELEGLPNADGRGFVANQHLTCMVLLGWAKVRCGDEAGLAVAMEAMEGLDEGEERVLHAALRSFIADACIRLDDQRAVDLLDRAERDSLQRGERWWLAETLRLRAAADEQFGDGSRAEELRARAAALAELQGAGLIAERLSPRG